MGLRSPTPSPGRPGQNGVFPYAGRAQCSANDAWVIAHGDRFVRLHRVPTGTVEWELDVRAHPLARGRGRFDGSGPEVSDDGTRVLLHWGQSIEWWDTRRRALICAVPVAGADERVRIPSAHLSRDGAHIALCPRQDEPVTVIDAAGAVRQLSSACKDLTFLADGRLIGVVGAQLREFDPRTGTPSRKEIRLARDASSIRASPSGRLVAVSGWKHIEVLNTSTWTTLFSASADVIRATFSLDETRLAVVSSDLEQRVLTFG